LSQLGQLNNPHGDRHLFIISGSGRRGNAERERREFIALDYFSDNIRTGKNIRTPSENNS
jgi:hypothetical protein